MGAAWRDCIVTLIDLVGTSSQAEDKLASIQMQKLHRAVLTEVETAKYSFYHVYAYNDSVLTLTYIDPAKSSYETAMRDADALKKELDQIQNLSLSRVSHFLQLPTVTSAIKLPLSRPRAGPWRIVLKLKRSSGG